MARAATAAGAATQTRVAVGSERSSRKTAFLDDRFVTVVKNDAEFDSQIGDMHFSRIGFCHVCKNDATYDIQVEEEHFLPGRTACPLLLPDWTRRDRRKRPEHARFCGLVADSRV